MPLDDVRNVLRTFLDRFKAARRRLKRAMDHEARFYPRLGDKLARRGAEMLKSLHEMHKSEADSPFQIDAAKWNEEIHKTHEQRIIEGIRRRRVAAEGEIQALREDVRKPLIQLAAKDWAAKPILDEFDQLPSSRLSLKTTVDSIIDLLDGVVPVRARGQRLETSQMTDVKRQIREMKEARCSCKEICDRLGKKPRPRKAKWRHLSWPEAYERHPGSVAKWISTV